MAMLLALTQAPPHAWYPSLHAAPHLRFEHVAVPLAIPGHTLAQAPQCAGSLSTSTHDPSHASRPGAHLEAHELRLHTSIALHAVAHDPQCSCALTSAISHPSSTFALQSACWSSHAAMAQVPARVHAVVACASEHGSQPFDAHPKRGSTSETHFPAHSFRPASHVPSGFGAWGAGTSTTRLDEASGPPPGTTLSLVPGRPKSAPTSAAHPGPRSATVRNAKNRLADPDEHITGRFGDGERMPTTSRGWGPGSFVSRNRTKTAFERHLPQIVFV